VLAGGYASIGVEFSAFRSVLIKRRGDSRDRFSPQPSDRSLSLFTGFPPLPRNALCWPGHDGRQSVSRRLLGHAHIVLLSRARRGTLDRREVGLGCTRLFLSFGNAASDFFVPPLQAPSIETI